MDRRTLLQVLGASAMPMLGACGRDAVPQQRTSAGGAAVSATESTSAALPAIFLAHGAPPLLDDTKWVGELAAWAKAMPRPRAILMISAHWTERPVAIGATETVPLVYDFYGFPKRYYEVTYAAPGAPDVARRVRELLGKGQTTEDPKRGLDHGAYVPLVAMYPRADVPVLQISIPTMEPEPLVALGRALAPLRKEGVLIVGSGFLTHNMRAVDFGGGSPPPAWASEFDAWCAEVLAKKDVDALVHYRERAPGVRMSLPTHEHFVPVLVALGAALETSGPVQFPIEGFAFGSFTKRSVQLG